MSTPEKRAKSLAYYYAHRDRILERQRERYHNDEEYREYRIKQAKEWHRDNPTQVYHNHKDCCARNKDKVQAIYHKWYIKNREKVLAKKKERRNANA